MPLTLRRLLKEHELMQHIDYQCSDCGMKFGIVVTDEEAGGSLVPTHTEACPGCGQVTGKGRVTCRSCAMQFDVALPHWHVHCNLANAPCPTCGTAYVSLCIC